MASAGSRVYRAVDSIVGFLRMPLLFDTITGHARASANLRACIPGYEVADILADVIFPTPSVVSESNVVAYAASCGCLLLGRLPPGMPSLRSCMPGYGVADILADVIFLTQSVGMVGSGVAYQGYINMASVRKPVS